MKEDVKDWIAKCELCARRKNTGVKTKVPLTPIKVEPKPFELCAWDVMGPLPESIKGNKYILVFMDYLTKFPEAFALPDQTAEK